MYEIDWLLNPDWNENDIWSLPWCCAQLDLDVDLVRAEARAEIRKSEGKDTPDLTCGGGDLCSKICWRY